MKGELISIGMINYGLGKDEFYQCLDCKERYCAPFEVVEDKNGKLKSERLPTLNGYKILTCPFCDPRANPAKE